jgi:hypothetical protein
MKIAVAGLIICVLVAVFFIVGIRMYNHKKAVEWCREHGYGNYATSDGYCVGPGGKLIEAKYD